MVTFFQHERGSDAPFDIIIGSSTPGDDPARATEIVAPYAEAGCTWWNESIAPWDSTADDVRQRLRQGPPRL